MDFAVSIEGVHGEDKGSWVLEVEGDKVLVAHDDNTLHWHPLADCTMLKIHTPDQPTLVLPVQAKPQNGIVTARPQDNRMLRRRDGG